MTLISRGLIHPDYSARSLTNDMAVLVLEEPLEYTDTVAQVVRAFASLHILSKKTNPQACLPRPGNGLADGTRFGLLLTFLHPQSN